MAEMLRRVETDESLSLSASTDSAASDARSAAIPNQGFPCIEFDLPAAALVTLQLFDDAGQEVARLLHNTPFQSGVHRVAIALENELRSSQLYRLSVRSEGRVAVVVKRLPRGCAVLV
jgi:hypothetical protein